MLQINTGKLYVRGVGITNKLRGVLYSNLRLPHDRDITTEAGTLLQTGSDLAIVYELAEQIEAAEKGPGVLVSHGVMPYLDDFAVVASFGLGGVVSRSEGAVRLLTDARPTLSARATPKEFVSRFFDAKVYLKVEEVEEFEAFISRLLALERKSYLGAMGAMRTMVASLHRIPEDLAQAYTLMVSAVESLAQQFDEFTPRWNDIPDQKRKALDAALETASPEVSDAVKRAMLTHEHVALARRYRAFALSHIDDAFFRQETRSARSLARYEVEQGLRQAYDFRSAYVHQVRQLPDELTRPFEHYESTVVGRRPALTFEGLYRLTRHVIRAFVASQPTVEREPYDYLRESAGVVIMQWAPQYWVGKPIAHPKEARMRFEALLSLAAAIWLQEPDAVLPDMHSAIADVERLLPQAGHKDRPALLALHLLYNLLLTETERTPEFDAFIAQHEAEAVRPGVDSITLATMFGVTGDWPLDEHENVLAKYFEQRVQKSGLHAPRLVEAAMCLTLAERLRCEGREDDARRHLGHAVECFPDHAALRALEKSFSLSETIAWRKVLLPSGDDDENGEARSDETM